MRVIDYYILGSFLFGLLMSYVSGLLVWRLTTKARKETYVELNISPRLLRDIATQAVDSGSEAIILPAISCDKDSNQTIQITFVDQRMRLESIYEELNCDE